MDFEHLIIEQCQSLSSMNTINSTYDSIQIIRIRKCPLLTLSDLPQNSTNNFKVIGRHVFDFAVQNDEILLNRTKIDVESQFISLENKQLHIQSINIHDCKWIEQTFNTNFQQNSITNIKIEDCYLLNSLSGFTNHQVEHLILSKCNTLQNLQGLALKNTSLKIYDCQVFDSLLQLQLNTTLKRLELNCVGKLNSLKGLPKQVEELVITDCNALKDFSEIDIENGKLQQLRINEYDYIYVKEKFLSMSNLAIKDCTAIDRIVKSELIENVTIWNCNKILLKGFPQQIRELNLFGCHSLLNFDGIDYLNSNIEIIIIGGNNGIKQLTQIPINVKEFQIFECSNFKKLKLYKQSNLQKVSIQQCQQLSVVNKLPISLRELIIENCSQISSVGDVEMLTTLEINQCTKLTSIKCLKIMVNLQHLSLQSNNIHDISALQDLIQLVELNLQNNSIDQISALNAFSNLLFLDISQNQIVDQNQLQVLVKLNKLQIFKCSGNKFCSNSYIEFMLANVLPHSMKVVVYGMEYNKYNRTDLIQRVSCFCKNNSKINPFADSNDSNSYFINYFKLLFLTSIQSKDDTYCICQIHTLTQSTVYIALSQQQHTLVAIKVSFNDLFYVREKSFVFRNLNHNNIIKAIDAFEYQSNVYGILVMPLGKQFKEVFDTKIPLQLFLKFVSQIVDALVFLHSQTPKIMHRDIKPDNIILLPDEQSWKAVVIDFGSSSLYEEKRKRTMVGTQGFTAPEIFQSKPYDERCDTFSMGKTILKWIVEFNIVDGESKLKLYDITAIAQIMSRKDPQQRPKLQHILEYLLGRRELNAIEIDQRE